MPIRIQTPRLLKSSLTYTGSLQFPTILNYNSSMMSLSGDISAEDTGDYSITVNILKGYCWADGTSSAITLNYSIVEEAYVDTADATATNLDIMSGSSAYVKGSKVIGSAAQYNFDIPQIIGEYSYTGAEQSVEVSSFFSEFMELVGGSATDVGTHIVTVSLKDTTTSCWKDGSRTPKELSWVIDKGICPAPMLDEYYHRVYKDEYTPGETVTLNVTTLGGTVYAESSDSSALSIYRDSEDPNKFSCVLTSVDVPLDDLYVTITVGESSNYHAYTDTDTQLKFFFADEPEAYVSFASDEEFSLAHTTANWDGIVEYSTDLDTWEEWDGSAVNAESTGEEYVLYLRGSGNTHMGDQTTPVLFGPLAGRFEFSGSDIRCGGTMEALLDYESIEQRTVPESDRFTFYSLFATTPIVSTPKFFGGVYNVGYLRETFNGCKNLQSVPFIPTSSLYNVCYYQTFGGTNIEASTEKTDTCLYAMLVPSSGHPATTGASGWNTRTFPYLSPEVGQAFYISVPVDCR